MNMTDDAQWIKLTEDGGVQKKILREGTEGAVPQAGQEITAHYTGTLEDGTKFDSSRDRGSPFKFTLGQGQVIKGWDIGFASMLQGEHAILKCTADYAYGQNPRPGGVIKPGDTLLFDCELISFADKPRELWQMSSAEKVQEATNKKELGNKLFAQKQFLEAAAVYAEGAAFLADDAEGDGKDTALACHLNTAQAFLSAQKYTDALNAAQKALKLDSKSVKALFRRAVARRHTGQYDEAQADLAQVLELEPTNTAAAKEQQLLKAARKQASAKEKKLFAGAFNKVNMYQA